MRSCSLIAGFLFAAISSVEAAKPEIAPMPREVVKSATSENPAETVERIVTNAKAVGERLAQNDPGTDTRRTQADILRDIDTLIRQQENPPPMPNDSSPMPIPMPKDGSGESGKSKSSGGSKRSPGLPSDSDGNSQANGQKKRTYRNRPMPGGEQHQTEPGPMASNQPKDKDKQNGKAGNASGNQPTGGLGGKLQPRASQPLDGDIAKDVWGHLPEQLRQQVSEYYRQQFMPQYAELLRQYYSSLAERDRKPGAAPSR